MLMVACVQASLKVFQRAGGLSPIRRKSILLTGGTQRHPPPTTHTHALFPHAPHSPLSPALTHSHPPIPTLSPSTPLGSPSTSPRLPGYMEALLIERGLVPSKIQIQTPSDPTRRGCQLSLRVGAGSGGMTMREVCERESVAHLPPFASRGSCQPDHFPIYHPPPPHPPTLSASLPPRSFSPSTLLLSLHPLVPFPLSVPRSPFPDSVPAFSSRRRCVHVASSATRASPTSSASPPRRSTTVSRTCAAPSMRSRLASAEQQLSPPAEREIKVVVVVRRRASAGERGRSRSGTVKRTR